MYTCHKYIYIHIPSSTKCGIDETRKAEKNEKLIIWKEFKDRHWLQLNAFQGFQGQLDEGMYLGSIA